MSGPSTDACTTRELGPRDAEAIRELYAALDNQDSYYRFFAPQPKDLSPLARDMAARDGRHRAVGAYLDGNLVGVANYIDLDIPHVAEVAIVVAHHDQLHGIGTRLLADLIDLARADGIDELVGDVLNENYRAMRIVFEAPYPVSVGRDGPVTHVAIHIDTPLTDHIPGLVAVDTR
jgi:GNAT superfamily N-acetyltransferase